MPDAAVFPVPPEEEELFREFEAYVRSIYAAATAGAVEALQTRANEVEQQLRNAADDLKAQTAELADTVARSRDSYADLFAPAIARMETSTQALVQTQLARTEQQVAALTQKQQDQFARMEQQVAALADHQRRAVSGGSWITAASVVAIITLLILLLAR